MDDLLGALPVDDDRGRLADGQLEAAEGDANTRRT
jgi:hypothetical protein